MSAATPVTVFFSYAHEDDEHRKDLEGHLKILERRGMVKPWHDRKILSGDRWDDRIDGNLSVADLILLLISKDFIESDYIWGKELKVAMERNGRGEARVVPILVRAVNIEPGDAPFMQLQGLPTDLVPVTSWPNVDEAWANVAKGLRAVVQEIQAAWPSTPDAPEAAAPGHAAAPSPVPDTGESVAGQATRQARTSPAPATGDFLGTPPQEPLGAQPATPPPDPLLQQVIHSISEQIEQANAEKGGATLDSKALHRQVLRLIDTPQQKRVLWVDDQPQGNRHEIAALAKLQIDTVTVGSTDEAMRRLRSDREQFDLVVSDWDRRAERAEAGLELLRQLRAANCTTPLIFYHGEWGRERRALRALRARAAGAEGEATLPAELLQLVTDVLG